MKKYKYDIYRYYGKNNESIKQRLFRPMELKYIIIFRKYQESKFMLLRIYYILRIKRLSKKTHIQIPYTTKIGKGLYIGHLGRIIVNPNAIIGNNVNIATGVTIGQENRGMRKGSPIIGNNVWIGTNSVIVGKINIGNDVLVAPLSYINFDVPDHSIVIGNPGKIIKKDNATKDYINNVVENDK